MFYRIKHHEKKKETCNLKERLKRTAGDTINLTGKSRLKINLWYVFPSVPVLPDGCTKIPLFNTHPDP